MMKIDYQNTPFGFRISLIALMSSLLLSCIPPMKSSPITGEWISLAVFIDGIMQVQASLPPPDQLGPVPKNKLIASEVNKSSTLFVEGYNPGRGKYDGMDFVHITGTITRIDKEDGDDTSIDFEDIKQTLYLSRPEIQGHYEIVGTELIGGEQWLRVNFIGDPPRRGVAYYRLVYGPYALMVSMRMFGERSDETKLYQERHEDLKKVLQSVQVTVEDFELKRANEK